MIWNTLGEEDEKKEGWGIITLHGQLSNFKPPSEKELWWPGRVAEMAEWVGARVSGDRSSSHLGQSQPGGPKPLQSWMPPKSGNLHRSNPFVRLLIFFRLEKVTYLFSSWAGYHVLPWDPTTCRGPPRHIMQCRLEDKQRQIRLWLSRGRFQIRQKQRFTEISFERVWNRMTVGTCSTR